MGYEVIQDDDPAAAVREAAASAKSLLVVGRAFVDSLRAAPRSVPVVAVTPIWKGGKARVALASAVWAEKEGTFTNLDSRVQRFQKAVDPIDAARTELEIASTLGKSLGVPLPPDPREAFDSLASEVSAFSNLTLEDIGDTGKPATP